jgi:TetR/AcrR family transcriptional repressor of nem operon
MPYPAGHRDQVRERIVRSARELFNRRGFEGTSVDAIMAAAGLTRGGFYSYFKTKEELYAEAIRLIVADMHMAEWEDLASSPNAFQVVKSIINAYLSDDHLSNIECQCPLITQPNDVARTGTVAKWAYRDVFLYMLETVAKALTGSGHRDPGLPYALTALLVGSMTLARSVGDEELAKRIRDSSRRQALRLVEPPSKDKEHAIGPVKRRTVPPRSQSARSARTNAQ